MYISDILLGYEPAFNATEACEIIKDLAGLSYDNEHLLKKFPEQTLGLYQDLEIPHEALL